jgi:hypothetical protein
MSVDTSEPESMSVPEAGRHFLDLGYNASYEAVKAGAIPVIRVGKRKMRVPVALMKAKMRGEQ